ncbi:MAG: sigma 54-interacting transcriptional regulator [Bdellovibrionales bacterium]|nr:sigma 54-interacting transcriptional regulator [Bdellovibrionales bacterium]
MHEQDVPCDESALSSFSRAARSLLAGKTVRDFLLSTPDHQDPEQLRETLSKLVLVRVIILSGLLSTHAWVWLVAGGKQSSTWLFSVIGLTYAVSAANALWLRKTSHIQRVGYLQLVVDVILSTLAIYVTSSLVSISLYLLIIVAAALMFSRHGAVIIAALSGLCYAALASGLLPPIGGKSFSAAPQDILGVYIALVGIAVMSGYFAKQLELVNSIANAKARDLTELTKQQSQLFNDVSDGIITVDLTATITSINEAARAIMGLAALDVSHFVGKPLKSIAKDFELQELNELFQKEETGHMPEELTLAQGEQEKHLSYSVKSLTDSEGSRIGRMLIFNDVSQVKSMKHRLDMHERMTKLLAETNEDPRSALGTADIQMIGETPVMQRVFSLVRRVAASEASVLITGESGTGKELVAKAIHTNSDRAERPFIAINCGAIPENLIESELFGHKKGAFTGAVSDNPGLFKEAKGGTIFLDEVGELPLHLQTKLLRVLQDRTIRSVGDTRDVAVDVRIIAATNRELKREIAEGRFREDLYYRLNVVNIMLPSLRDRTEDIPLLVRHFTVALSRDKESVPQISPEALDLLSSYTYPGNVRELENIIERALVLGGHAILPEHLPEEVLSASRQHHSSIGKNGAATAEETEIVLLPVNLEAILERMERDYLLKALDQSNGVKKHAAELLGLNFRSFRYRLKKYGLSDNSADEVS